MWNPLKDWVGWLLIISLVGGSLWGYFHRRENPREAAIREIIERVHPRIPFWWKAIAPYAGRINSFDEPEAFRRQFESIPLAARHLLAANWCQAEVLNDGLEQFFSNSTGIVAPEAVDGFRALGMDDAADVLQQAMDVFPQPYPRERKLRKDVLGQLDERRGRGELFEDLNNRFVELMSSRDNYLGRFNSAANRYVRKNLK